MQACRFRVDFLRMAIKTDQISACKQNIRILYRYNGDCWSSQADNSFIKSCLRTCEDLEKNFSMAHLQSVRTVVQELQHVTDIFWVLNDEI